MVASALPGFMVNISSPLMTSWDNDCGDFGICFIGVSVITFMDTSRRLEASLSSKLPLVEEIKTG